MRRIKQLCLVLLFPTTLIVFLLWVIGQITRDSSWLLGLLFYIPSSVLVTWLALSTCVSRWRRSRLWVGYAILMPMPLWFVIFVENHFDDRSKPVPPMSLRLVHWNIGWSKMGWDRQKALLRELDADILVLSEVDPAIGENDFPGYHIQRTKDMLIACRGPVRIGPSLVPGGALDALPVECSLPSGSVKLIMADMTSNLQIWRDQYLRPFLKVIEQQQPDLIVGDFNAPRRSLAFSELPEGFEHAYDSCGGGLSYTWPVPVPFLAIDQCILGPRVDAHRYELQSTTLSDHRLQLLHFQIPR